MSSTATHYVDIIVPVEVAVRIECDDPNITGEQLREHILKHRDETAHAAASALRYDPTRTIGCEFVTENAEAYVSDVLDTTPVCDKLQIDDIG